MVIASSTRRVWDGLAVVALIAVAVVSVLTFRDYGLGWDDYTHAEYGDLLLTLLASGFADRRALSFVNLYAYGGGFDMLAALAAKVSPFDLFETRRLCGAILGLIGLAATWRIGRRLGGPLAGALALALLAADPLYFGHMFFNPKDAPFAIAMTILLLGLVRAFEEYPAPSAATVTIFSIGLGLAIGTRVIGALAALYALAAILLIVGAEARKMGARAAGRDAAAFVLALWPGLILAYAVLALVWPWAVVSPLNPLKALVYFSHFFEKPWKEMFAGVAVPVLAMPRAYVPQLLALKTPEILLLLGIAGIAGVGVAVLQRRAPIRWRAALLVLALAATVPVVLTVAMRPAMYNGLRHFVFVTPPMAVLGALAGAWIIAGAARAWRGAGALAAIAVAIGLAVPVVEMIRLHPYEYTHFNWIAGGVRAADERYMLDYWGLAFKQASQELRAQLTERLETPSRRRWQIAVCGPHRPAQVELGPEFAISWNPKGADFAMTLGEFYCAELPAPVLVEIAREGVVYARVYDIRGRAITSLLTLPAP